MYNWTKTLSTPNHGFFISSLKEKERYKVTYFKKSVPISRSVFHSGGLRAVRNQAPRDTRASSEEKRPIFWFSKNISFITLLITCQQHNTKVVNYTVFSRKLFQTDFLTKYTVFCTLLFFPLGKTTMENNVLCKAAFHFLPYISLYKNLPKESKA